MLSRRSFLISGLGALATPSLLLAQKAGFNEREIVPQLAANDKEDIWTLHFRFQDPRIIVDQGARPRDQDRLVHGLPRLQPRPAGGAGHVRAGHRAGDAGPEHAAPGRDHSVGRGSDPQASRTRPAGSTSRTR